MSSMLIRFLDSVAGKYGCRTPKVAQELFSEGKMLTRYAGETPKGMKWVKYYDQASEKLVAYEQAYNGKAKMVVYDLPDNPVTVVKLPQNGRVDIGRITREMPYEKYCTLDYLHGLTENIRQRFGSIYDEMCTGHSWLG